MHFLYLLIIFLKLHLFQHFLNLTFCTSVKTLNTQRIHIRDCSEVDASLNKASITPQYSQEHSKSLKCLQELYRDILQRYFENDGLSGAVTMTERRKTLGKREGRVDGQLAGMTLGFLLSVPEGVGTAPC